MIIKPIGIALLVTSSFVGCHPGQTPLEGQNHDPRALQLYMHIGYHNEIDTFRGFLQKDLVTDTVRIPLWFTTREQEIILNKLEVSEFFGIPDTILARSDLAILPNGGAQVIHVKYADKEKTVVWFEPKETSFKSKSLLHAIRNLIFDIAKSWPEYKALPKPRGAYY